MASGFFEDDKGNLSSIRLMSFMSWFIAVTVTVVPMIQSKPIDYNVLIIWITAAFAPKVIQKFAENLNKNG